ncbi:hypothetical protein GCM10027275_27070 [Rhabdobacter roseus]
MKSNYKTTTTLSILTPFLLIGVFLLMGGGHGTYVPGILLFPTGLISFSIFHRLEIPFIIIGILQYPFYGLLIDRAKNKPKVTLIILAFHFGLVILTFITTNDL